MYRITHGNLSVQKKVNAIKGLRSLTGFGLKQAKEAIEVFYHVDGSYYQPTADHLDVEARQDGNEQMIVEGLQYLRDAGCEITEPRAIEDHLIAAAREALSERDTDVDLAVTLLHLVQDRQRKREEQDYKSVREVIADFEAENVERDPTIGELIQQQMDSMAEWNRGWGVDPNDQ